MGSPGLLGSLKTIFCKGSEIPSVRTQLRSTDFKQKVVQSLDAIIPEVKQDGTDQWNLSLYPGVLPIESMVSNWQSIFLPSIHRGVGHPAHL